MVRSNPKEPIEQISLVTRPSLGPAWKRMFSLHRRHGRCSDSISLGPLHSHDGIYQGDGHDAVYQGHGDLVCCGFVTFTYLPNVSHIVGKGFQEALEYLH